MQLLNQPLWAFYSTTLRKIRTFGVITSINSFCCSITVIVTLLKTFFSHRQYTITIPRGKKLISLLPTGLGKTKRMCITHVHSCTFYSQDTKDTHILSWKQLKTWSLWFSQRVCIVRWQETNGLCNCEFSGHIHGAYVHQAHFRGCVCRKARWIWLKSLLHWNLDHYGHYCLAGNLQMLWIL